MWSPERRGCVEPVRMEIRDSPPYLLIHTDESDLASALWRLRGLQQTETVCVEKQITASGHTHSYMWLADSKKQTQHRICVDV